LTAYITGINCKRVHSMVHGIVCLDAIKAHDKTNLVLIPGWTIT